jgi:acetyl-CoA carboxylase biotin carboxylase subunit
VPPHYDSLIAKLLTYGAERADAVARMQVALEEFRIGGISTNIPLHQALMQDPAFARGGFDIHHLEKWLGQYANDKSVAK